MTSLLTRLAQAKGPDEELVKDVVRALCPKVMFQPWPGYDKPLMYHVEPVFGEKALLPDLLGSFDAVLGLMLPGWKITDMRSGDPTALSTIYQQCHVAICPCNGNDDGWQIGVRDGLAWLLSAALLIAILRARGIE